MHRTSQHNVTTMYEGRENEPWKNWKNAFRVWHKTWTYWEAPCFVWSSDACWIHWSQKSDNRLWRIELTRIMHCKSAISRRLFRAIWNFSLRSTLTYVEKWHFIVVTCISDIRNIIARFDIIGIWPQHQFQRTPLFVCYHLWYFAKKKSFNERNLLWENLSIGRKFCQRFVCAFIILWRKLRFGRGLLRSGLAGAHETFLVLRVWGRYLSRRRSKAHYFVGHQRTSMDQEWMEQRRCVAIDAYEMVHLPPEVIQKYS